MHILILVMHIPGLSMAMNTSHEVSYRATNLFILRNSFPALSQCTFLISNASLSKNHVQEKEISESSCTVRQSSSGQGGPLYPGGCPQFPYPTSSSSTSPSRDHGSSKEISEERAPTFESISEEGSPSFKLSFSSNDLSAGESHAGSSDGWSKRSFSEFMFLLDSYQRDDINSQLSSSSFSSDLQTCGLCSKLLRERASWKGNEICTAAILVCGHVYHAECLETVTSNASKFDPSCPVCTHGESSTGRVLVKASSKSRSKISKRSAVADIIIDGTEDQKSRSCILKELKSGASSSGKSSFGLSFFRRPFSIMGSRSIKLSPKRECSRKKGFWARYR